jgi:hypothetical protein
VARMGEGRNVHGVLVGKPKRKRQLGRPGRRWEDGIKMDLREIGWGVEWIHLAQDRDRLRAVVNAVMNFRFLAPQLVSHVTQTPSCLPMSVQHRRSTSTSSPP